MRDLEERVGSIGALEDGKRNQLRHPRPKRRRPAGDQRMGG